MQVLILDKLKYATPYGTMAGLGAVRDACGLAPRVKYGDVEMRGWEAGRRRNSVLGE